MTDIVRSNETAALVGHRDCLPVSMSWQRHTDALLGLKQGWHGSWHLPSRGDRQ